MKTIVENRSITITDTGESGQKRFTVECLRSGKVQTGLNRVKAFELALDWVCIPHPTPARSMRFNPWNGIEAA